MEVHLNPDTEARLQQFAHRSGKNAEQLVEEAVDRMLQYDERFSAAVEEGRAAARRGDLLEHDEVVERYKSASGALRLTVQPDEVRSVQLQELRNRLDRALGESARGEGTDGEEFLQGMLDELDAGHRRTAG